MKTSRKSNVTYYIGIIMIALFIGCSVQQTHKTLVFFFDGVDQIKFFNDYLSKDSLTKQSNAKRDALLKKHRPDRCVHLPYKEKKCELCHTPDKRLVMPMPGLCFKCHKSFSETYEVVHGPVASGGCMNCHNQHSSKYPKLLIREGQDICLYCHNTSLVFANKVHRDIEDAECVLCHNPHGGKTRFMVKGGISKDANRIALMPELSYRHLYGQVQSKVPGVVYKKMEINIVDDKGKIVATVHPDMDGKFYMANLHPNKSYNFVFKHDCPDCIINVMDVNGTQLYAIEKNKFGKFSFSHTDYETLHNAINEAHELGDSLVMNFAAKTGAVENTDHAAPKDTTAIAQGSAKPADVLVAPAKDKEEPAKPAINTDVAKNATDTATRKSKIIVTDLPPEPFKTAENKPTKPLDTVAVVVDTQGYKGKIIVKELPPEPYKPADIIPVKPSDAITGNVDTTLRKSKIIVKEIPADDKATNALLDSVKASEANRLAGNQGQEPRKSKIVVRELDDTSVTLGGVVLPDYSQYEKNGVKLSELSRQIAKFYPGTVVCIMNDSTDLMDINQVNEFGEFSLYDFANFKISMPPKNSGIISQTIYLNDRMEVIETFNKRIVNGHAVYTPNSKEKGAKKAEVKIMSNRENPLLFSTIYIDDSKTNITRDGIMKLMSVVDYLRQNPTTKAYIVAHSDDKGSEDGNQQLSEDRAKEALNFIVSKGIRRSRLQGKGFGKTKHINTIAEGIERTDDGVRKTKVEIYIKVIDGK